MFNTPHFQGRVCRLIPDWETKIPYASECHQKKKKVWSVLVKAPDIARNKPFGVPANISNAGDTQKQVNKTTADLEDVCNLVKALKQVM